MKKIFGIKCNQCRKIKNSELSHIQICPITQKLLLLIDSKKKEMKKIFSIKCSKYNQRHNILRLLLLVVMNMVYTSCLTSC